MAEFLSPVGRLVQGDAFTPQEKDQQGNPRVVKTGPNAGQPNPQYYIGVAFAKDNPEFPAFYALMDAEARQAWPQFFPNGGQCTNPKFAWKLIDGDGHDDNGQPWANREGFAGHWIVRFTNGFAPKVHFKGKYGAHEQVTDKSALKRGYYVRVGGDVRSNNNPANPGVYMNFGFVEIFAYGPEILSGPDFAGMAASSQATYVPPGASAAPLASPSPATAGAPVTPVTMPSGGGAPLMPTAGSLPAGPTTSTPAMPGASPSSPMPGAPTPSPATGYPMPTGGPAPVAPAPAPSVPAAPLRQMTEKANGHSYETLIGLGWTDAQLIEQGIMVA